MGASSPALVADPVERFSRDRKVLLSPDHREEQLPKARTLHEHEPIRRQTAATDKTIDALVYELHRLRDEKPGLRKGANRGRVGGGRSGRR